MKTTLTGLEPIPVEYVLGIAQTKATAAQRKPYVELIRRWGEESGCEAEAQQLLRGLRDGQEIDVRQMPREFTPRYRQPEVAERLIEIVRQIDTVIATKQDNWTWAHVLRVMTDEGILFRVTVNRFDQLICSMIPDRGRDTVRKNGDYAYLMGQEEPWPMWPQSYLNPRLNQERIVCNQIALQLAPVLTRKIREEF